MKDYIENRQNEIIKIVLSIHPDITEIEMFALEQSVRSLALASIDESRKVMFESINKFTREIEEI